MNTVEINGTRKNVEYRTNSGMRTKAAYLGRTYKQGLSVDVYNVDDGKHVALVINTINGNINKSVTIISLARYQEIADLYDPYHGGRYHTALLNECGADNQLELY